MWIFYVAAAPQSIPVAQRLPKPLAPAAPSQLNQSAPPLLQNTAGPPLLSLLSAAPLSLACLEPLSVRQRREQTIAALKEKEAALSKRLEKVRKRFRDYMADCQIQRPQHRKVLKRGQLCSQSNLMNTQKRQLAFSVMDPLQLPPAPAWAKDRNSRILARQRRLLRIHRRQVPMREKRPDGNSDVPGTPQPRRLPVEPQITAGSSRSRRLLSAAFKTPVENKAKDEEI